MSRTPRQLLSVLLAAAVLSLGVAIVPAGATPAASAPRSVVSLGRMVSGEEAIRALGSSIGRVAAAHGKSVSQLARALRSDHRLAVDRDGRLLYRDAQGPGELPTDPMSSGAGSSAAPFPLENTFALHSLPGSKRTLYLDFDGAVLSGTAWNSNNGGADIVAPAWDIEGGAAVFTDAERARIQAIWQRVAEDYAPFDVDVTTELPNEGLITRSSTSDDVYGMRVLISPISSYFGSYGGIAYVGVFDMVGDYYKPALVFPEKLANAEKYIAEAASHEAGHTFGLLHDGTSAGVEYYAGHGSGDTGWAPIMGNSYYKNLTQWSRGEYPNANNTEDDFVVMQGNGVSYRADDHGNTVATATRLAAGTQLAASGLIGRTGDADVLAFSTGAGTVTCSVAPSAPAPNVDLLLEIRDGSGTVLASGNSVDYLTASVSATLEAGTYYAVVKGTGKGDLATGYSDYGSLGAWRLAGSVVDPGVAPVAPVAVVSATPSSGSAPLNVAFSGSASYDSDGSIVSYAWDFGDGTNGSGVSASHTYAAVGTYAATLTVTDATGLMDAASVSITVSAPPNVAPVAVIAAAPLAGQAPLPVSFDGGGSTDADGQVVSWQWRFGDGTSASGSSVSHTYAAAGSYTAVLTVTDDDGASASRSVVVQVTAAPAIAMHVESIQLSIATTKSGKQATARVRVVDANGQAVGGASVVGTWSGAVTGTASGTTDASGFANVASKRFKRGTVVFTVKTVSKSGYVYEASRNVVTTVSMATGSLVTRYLK